MMCSQDCAQYHALVFSMYKLDIIDVWEFGELMEKLKELQDEYRLDTGMPYGC